LLQLPALPSTVPKRAEKNASAVQIPEAAHPVAAVVIAKVAKEAAVAAAGNNKDAAAFVGWTASLPLKNHRRFENVMKKWSSALAEHHFQSVKKYSLLTDTLLNKRLPVSM
jgi:hypothetical protein